MIKTVYNPAKDTVEFFKEGGKQVGNTFISDVYNVTPTYTFTGTTPPSGSVSHIIQWTITDNKFLTLYTNITWSVVGVGITTLHYDLHPELPALSSFAGQARIGAGASDVGGGQRLTNVTWIETSTPPQRIWHSFNNGTGINVADVQSTHTYIIKGYEEF